MLGVIGGTAEWIFAFHDRISVTVSRRRRHRGPGPRRRWRARIWADVAKALDIDAPHARLADRQGKARHLRRHPGAGRQAARRQDRAGATCSWPATGPRPACPPPSRARCAPAKPRRLWRCANCLYMIAAHEPDQPRRIHRCGGASAPPPMRSWRQQRPDGHWVYELEADATIPAEYVLLVHYLGETPNLELERKIGVYLRRIQGEPWRLAAVSRRRLRHFRDGESLFRAEDDRRRHQRAAHGARARGDSRTRRRHQGQCLHPHPAGAVWPGSWNDVPTVPPELILLPRWFPIHLSKMSYWARTVIVPLLVLCAMKPVARNPRGIHVRELFVPGVPAAIAARAAPEPLLVDLLRHPGQEPQALRALLAQVGARTRRSRPAAPGPPNG